MTVCLQLKLHVDQSRSQERTLTCPYLCWLRDDMGAKFIGWRDCIPNQVWYVSQWLLGLLFTNRTHASIPLGQDFPPAFPSTVKHIYRQLLRVFAHIYHSHYIQILHLRSEPHFNSLFAHFLAFGREYELLDIKDVKGAPNAPVGIGLLWERWKDMRILEG
jgi:MOB kinase activator 1